MKDILHKAIHNCNNHLSTILSSCEVMPILATDDERKKKLEVIKARTRKMASILKSLDIYTKLENDDPLTQLPVSEIIKNSVQQLNSLHSIEFTYEIEDGLNANVNKKYIEQILLQLLKNSVEQINAQALKKEIVIRAKSEEHCIYISIVDYGKKLPDLTLEQMFEPFFTTFPENMGMGLTIAKNLANLMKAELFFNRQDEKNIFTLKIMK